MQVVLGGFLTQINLTVVGKFGICILDLSIFMVSTVLLITNHKRRTEVINTIQNCNKALRFHEQNYYINSEIDSATKVRFWITWLVIGLITSVLGIFVVLISLFCLLA